MEFCQGVDGLEGCGFVRGFVDFGDFAQFVGEFFCGHRANSALVFELVDAKEDVGRF